MTLFDIGNIIALCFALSFQWGLNVQNPPPGFWLGLIVGLLSGSAAFVAMHARIGKLSEHASHVLFLSSFLITPASALGACHIVWFAIRHATA
jgi:hypothetical protein